MEKYIEKVKEMCEQYDSIAVDIVLDLLEEMDKLKKENEMLHSAVEEDDKTKERYANEIKRLNEKLGFK